MVFLYSQWTEILVAFLDLKIFIGLDSIASQNPIYKKRKGLKNFDWTK
jgi:hypothetical protein